MLASCKLVKMTVSYTLLGYQVTHLFPKGGGFCEKPRVEMTKTERLLGYRVKVFAMQSHPVTSEQHHSRVWRSNLRVDREKPYFKKKKKKKKMLSGVGAT